MAPAVRVENLSKSYRLGVTHAGSLRELANRAASRFLKRPQPSQCCSLPVRTDRVERDGLFWALRNVQFEIQPGDVVGIIGRNGAGKSTLLKILSRITLPTTGRGELQGRVSSLLEVGTGFHPELTGRENVYLNGAILGMTRAEVRQSFDAIVAFAEIDRFIDTPVKRYSSGMYIRLAFAIAAHLEPDIMIVDEVLAVGDASFQQKCLGKMREVAGHGRTVLFVSHNLHALNALCSRGLLLQDGKLLLDGTTEECIRAYVQPTDSASSIWACDPKSSRNSLQFERITARLEGKQPDHRLVVAVRLSTNSKHKAAFLAIDVLDCSGTALMQAIPRLRPFITDAAPHHAFDIQIDLPRLIPGIYGLKLWAGSHNSETLNEVCCNAAFEVVDSPAYGRSFPHDRDHGHIVPHSTITTADREPAVSANLGADANA